MEHMEESRAEALRMMIDNIVKQAMFVPVADAQQLVREVDYHESFAPLFDPTWYMQNADNVRTRKGIFQAFAEFRSALERVKAEVRS
jgi:hypothetical protein